MTYLELIKQAQRLLDANKITLEEWSRMIEPLRRPILPDFLTEIVVHCRDCKYWSGEGYFCLHDMQGHADDYCSWGEWRTDYETD